VNELADPANRRRQEVDEFLEQLSPPIAHLSRRLRDLVATAVPEAIERLRPGWRLIGYDLPRRGGRGTYFAWVWPEVEHVHVGWQTGTLMSDPEHLLRGAHLKLKKVRYLTYAPGDRIPAKIVVSFTRDAARIAGLSRGELALMAEAQREAGAHP
jgi:hypothetical protein